MPSKLLFTTQITKLHEVLKVRNEDVGLLCEKICRIRCRVGRALPKGGNETTTAFKSRSIHLKDQLNQATSRLEPTTKRKLGVHDLLTQCQHYSASVRLDAVTGLRELLTSHSRLLHVHLSIVLHATSQLLLDKDALVRQAVLRMFRHVMPLVSTSQIAAFFPVLSSHLCSAMTHIYDDIQLDSLLFLDVCLDNYPTLVTDCRNNVLPNFIEQISRQNQTGSGSSGTAVLSTESGTRALLVNPSSKLSSQKWRVKVLGRLDKFLQAVVNQHSSHLTSSPVEIPKGVTSQWSLERETHVSVLPRNAAALALGQGVLIGTSPEAQFTGQRGGETFMSLDQLKSFAQIVTPLLLQCWVEVGPSQLNTTLPGNALSADTFAMLSGVLGVLKLLLQCVDLHSADSGQELNILEWLTKEYEREFVQHLLPAFPYGTHEPGKRRAKSGKRATQPAQGSPRTMNLWLCEVMSYFLLGTDHVNQKPKSLAWRERLINFITQTLRSERVSGTDLQSALKFVSKLLCLRELSTELRDDVLDAVFSCYSTKNATSTDKLMLLRFFSLLLDGSHQQPISRCEPVHKWMESLPQLLIDLGSISGASTKASRVAEVVMQIIKVVGCQANERFLESLQEKSVSILDGLLRSDFGDEVKRTVLEILQYLPYVEQHHLQCVVRHAFAHSVSAHVVQYAVSLVVNRYEKQGLGPGAIKAEDLLSFLFTLCSGTDQAELRSLQPLDSSTAANTKGIFIEANAVILQTWQHRNHLTQVAEAALKQMTNSEQAWRMFSTYTHRLLMKHQVVPIYTAHGMISGLLTAPRVEASCHGVTARCVHSLLLTCATLDDAQSLGAHARTTCFRLLAASPKLNYEYWSCVKDYLKTDCDAERALLQCACAVSMLDDQSLLSTVKTWIPFLQKAIQFIQSRFGEVLVHSKEWKGLLYKMSFFTENV